MTSDSAATERPTLRLQRLADLPVAVARRKMFTMSIFLVVLGVFLYMVHELLIAGILGAIIAAYLLPIQRRITSWVGHRAVAAVITLWLLVIPPIGLLIYGYVEVRRAAGYLAENTSEIAARINEALNQIPLVEEFEAGSRVNAMLTTVTDLAMRLPETVQSMVAEFAVDTAIFLFTAFYVLIASETIVAYLRAKVPPRYGAFAERLEEHVQGVLYGAIYGTLITQTIKAVLILAMNLLFGVPLPVVLALIAFVIGFFPIVGAWSVYVPTAFYLLIFQDSPWEAATMLLVGFFGVTLLLSLIVRPKLAAEQSRVLDFYWMFIAFVAGVYTFGVPGIVIGPIVVGVLKAVFDTITTSLDWWEENADRPDAEVFAEEKLGKPA